jgi:thiopurine S-methyltransferase
MEAAFWHQRWEENRIGFHQADFNRWLQSWWSAQQQGEPVLVPLCGKSRDMLWLSGQGHPVDGFELSAVAINSFFSENKLSETAEWALSVPSARQICASIRGIFSPPRAWPPLSAGL